MQGGQFLKTHVILDFPGGPVVKIPTLPTQGTQVQCLVGELRSCMLCGQIKFLKLIKKNYLGLKKHNFDYESYLFITENMKILV